MSRPISKSQIKAVHVALARQGIDDADYRAILREQFDAASCKDLSVAQAHQLIRRLYGGRAHERRRRPIQQPAAPAPSRTAGSVVRLASAAQQRLINALVGEIDWAADDGYRRWLERSLGLAQVRTSAEAARAIEGLKGLKRHGHRRADAEVE